MVEGASIRLVEGSNGIRFSATLSSYDDNNDYGFVIVPKRYIEDNGITDNYVTELQALAEVGAISDPIILYSKVHEVEGKNVIKGSITNILYQNINLEFVGIGFEYDGTNYNYASFEDIDDIARSAPRVAAACLNELYYDADIDEDDKLLYEDAEDVLKGYINTSINAKEGLSEDESNATTPEYSVAFASSEVSVDFGATKQLEVNANVPMDNAVWTSSSDIITVDENGLVTAKGVGSAIITVKSSGKEATCTVNVADVIVADGYVVDFNNDGYKYGVSGESYSGFWKADAVSAEYVANDVDGAKDGNALKVVVDIAKCRENKGMSYFVINFLANKGSNLTGEMLQIRFKATYNDGANNVDPFGYVINGTTAVLNGLDGNADVISVNLNVSDADSNGPYS